MANIQNAVRDTNCAVILLSKKYIESRWCQQEFEECMEEASKDSKYRVIVILMEEVAVLMQENLTPYMKASLHSRTYLDVTDSKLWEKLTKILEKHQTPGAFTLESSTWI